MIPHQLDISTGCPGGGRIDSKSWPKVQLQKIILQPSGGCTVLYFTVLRISVLEDALRLAPALFKWYCRELTPLVEHCIKTTLP